MKRTASRSSIVCAVACALMWASTLRTSDQHELRKDNGAQRAIASDGASSSDAPREARARHRPSRAAAPVEEEEYVAPYGEEFSEQEQRSRQRITQRSEHRLATLESRWRAESASRTGEASEIGEQVLQAVREQAPTAAGSLQMECRSTMCRFRIPTATVASLMAPMHVAASGHPARLTVLPQGAAELGAIEVVMDVAGDDFSGLGGI